MPRYFFNLFDGASSVIDDEGRNFDTAAAASEHGIRCARQIVAENIVADAPVRLSSYIAVVDDAGRELIRHRFADVVRFEAEDKD